jgi:NADH dehydrogenase FAD-containing subunit
MTEQELNALGLPARCTLVQGRLTDIDRKNRAVIVSDEVIVEYDVLVIASGMQGKVSIYIYKLMLFPDVVSLYII